MSEIQDVLYLIVKRPDTSFAHKWQGPHLMSFHANEKSMKLIEKHRNERLFVKVSTKREITCSVIVEDVQKNEDGTFMVNFKEIRTDHWVVPGTVRGVTRGCVEGPPPISVPMN
jgi:hypothetical protein